ncbi:Methyl-CpG-binding domain-containing protein 11 [Capsicum annuum]|uniref:methyl-CpG-binding domain-containing protein 10 n=1 Tax=Capsicum annuum TaxID=4072 RepID=UPI0007BF2818|nr:methyl-CpG-binding domain-containing protein 10 [Capsicum annuum]KAF3620636.1 Methyl-CpG-binding domain-containing protein 11 [Capsicum annuum]KAF3634831.1 Methyl-CpG-binding domain-containing protein 11 [Capsicum annuum]
MEKNDVVPIELPAPPGWKKRFTPRKTSKPRRNHIVFVAPDGDEITSKRQLEKYLKSHPGGPPASEFDWGTGDTPRRSSRLGEKSKATETPESATPSKKPRKSSSKKGAKEDGDEQEAEAATKKENKGSDEPASPDAEDQEVQDVEIATKKVLTYGDNLKDDEEKTNDGENVPEEPLASEDKMEIVQEKEETMDEGNIEKMEIQEAEDKPLDNSLNKTLPLSVLEEDKNESEPAGTDASSHSAELSKATSASKEESAEEVPAAADALNILEENKIESKPAGADTSSHSAELSKATSASQEESAAQEVPAAVDALNVLEENKIESKPAGTDAASQSAELSKATSASQEESVAQEVPAAADALNVLEENKIESKPAGEDASFHSAELSKAILVCQEESVAQEVPAAADALNVLEENKIEIKPAGEDASFHSAEFSKGTSASQEESAEEVRAAADPLVQNSNDAKKVDEKEQFDREIPIEEINGTEPAATGASNSVENYSVQQEETIFDQVTSS